MSEPNRIGEDHMANSKKARDMRRESIHQWNLIHLSLHRWNIIHKRLKCFEPDGTLELRDIPKAN